MPTVHSCIENLCTASSAQALLEPSWVISATTSPQQHARLRIPVKSPLDESTENPR